MITSTDCEEECTVCIRALLLDLPNLSNHKSQYHKFVFFFKFLLVWGSLWHNVSHQHMVVFNTDLYYLSSRYTSCGVECQQMSVDLVNLNIRSVVEVWLKVSQDHH